jgi:hypothetical protein
MFVEELKNNNEWEGFLQSSLYGTFYHSLKWKEIIQKSLCGFEHAHYLVVKTDNGTVVGICPAFVQKWGPTKVYASLPHSDYGGPIIRAGYIKQTSILLRNFIKDYCVNNGIAFAEICFIDDRISKFFKLPLSYVNTNAGVMVIDLKTTPSDVIWNSVFSRKQRYEIRRFERGDFHVREATTEFDLKCFYNLYISNMRKLGVSGFPYALFKNMWDALFPKNLLIMILEKEKCLGGLAQFKYNNSFYGGYVAIDRKWSWGRYSLMPFMMWNLIKKAEEVGIRYLSLGSTPSSKKHPYHNQKLKLGSTFLQQELVFTPFNCSAKFLMAAMAKFVPAWQSLKQVSPNGFNSSIERALVPFFLHL